MNARIEKKLSKRLVELCPTLFKGAWVSDFEPSILADSEGSRISHCMHIGGGADYWGEETDCLSVWQYLLNVWPWIGEFPTYQSGHEFEHYPNTSGFRATTKNLIGLARAYELKLQKVSEK